jgi:Protein of unknown function (DUF3298)
MKTLGMLLSALLAFSLSACTRRQLAAAETASRPQSVSVVSPTPTPSPTPSANEIKFRSKTLNEHVPDIYKITAEYPQFEGPESKRARAFNRWLENFVLSDVVEFRGLERAAMKKEKGKPPPIEESLEIGYDIVFANRDLISIKFDEEVMALGQMHPIDYPVPVNYDLKNGRLIKLSSLFKAKTNYLDLFSRYCRDELRNKTKDPLMMRGTEPKAENYKNWNIAPEGIMISFDDYQVGPHSMGQPVIVIPYAVLKDLLASDTVIAGLTNATS